jgi:hypothetical protein
MDSYPADATMWKEITPNKLGNWTLKFEFLGNYFPAGRYLEGNIITATSGGTNFAQSEYHKPSSDGPYTFLVQCRLITGQDLYTHRTGNGGHF